MSGQSYSQSDGALLRLVQRAGGRAGYKQLVRELGMGGGRERRLLLEQLAKMTARGALVKLESEQWALPAADVERAKRAAVFGGAAAGFGGEAAGFSGAAGVFEGGGEGERLMRDEAGNDGGRADGSGSREAGEGARFQDAGVAGESARGGFDANVASGSYRGEFRGGGGRRGFAAAMRARAAGRSGGGRGGDGRGGRASRRGAEDLVAGRLQLHRDGFGFVRPNGSEGGKDDDIFIPPHDLNTAMQGDQVLVDAGPPTREGRRAGRIVRVLTRRNPTVVGIFHAAGSRGRGASGRGGLGDAWRFDSRSSSGSDDPRLRGSYVVPLDTRLGNVVLIPDDTDLPVDAVTPHRTLGEDARHAEHRWDGSLEDLQGLAVDVEITHFATEHSAAQGRVVEVLGDPEAFGVDVEIVIRKHHLPHVFPAEVLVEARDAAAWTVAAMDAEEVEGRRDFRGERIVTIDGETARDFDDAVLVRENADGTFELQVHIADVAEYVREGSALDLEARLRGNSVYFPDRAIPMLPQELSSGECSLRPEEDRMVLSCVARIDAEGHVLGYELCEGLIRSAQRMTYTNVQRVLDGEAGARAEFAPFVADFERMLDLAKRLNGKRVRRGSIDFDLPEPVIEFDERGAMRGVVRSERAWANRLIEEFMLCANECVARWIEAAGVPGIYRIHEVPDAKRIVDFEEQAAGFGYTLGVGALPVQRFVTKGDKREAGRRNERDRERGKTGSRTARGHEVTGAIDVSPKLYQRLTAKIAGKPEERILSYLMLRSLKQAKYSADNEGHFALAAASYTHFTSPIRRYPDLIVHRVVKTLLGEGADARGAAEEQGTGNREQGTASPRKSSFEEPYAHGELAGIAQETSETERRAADAERELIETKKLKFMADRVGEDFDAIVLSVTKYGFFVELQELFVEGLVPIYTLMDDRYTFREGAREICGAQSGRCYKPGMRVRVLLDRIDRENRRLQFAVLGETAGSDRGAERRGEKTEAPAGTRAWVPRKGKARPVSGPGGGPVSARKAGGAGRDGGLGSPDRSGKPKKGRGKGRGKKR